MKPQLRVRRKKWTLQGIPVSDFPGLFHRHSPHHIRARAIEHRIMGGAAENVYRVVPPLSFEAKDEAEIAGRDPTPLLGWP